MSHKQDAFTDDGIKKTEIKNLPIVFNYLERSKRLAEVIQIHFAERVSESSEFNTTTYFVVNPNKPTSRVF